MQQLPDALAPLAAYRQFCLYKLVWDSTRQKYQKIPINPHTLNMYPAKGDWQRDPEATTDAAHALTSAQLCGHGYGVGFLFTDRDPFYFFDIDDCLMPDGKTWSAMATQLLGRFPGAAVEVSQSGTGLHVIGTGTPSVPSDSRRKKSTSGDFDLYTEWRFVALTGTNIIGNAAQPADQAQLDYVVTTYLAQQTGANADVEWSDGPVPEWTGPTDDDVLIQRALDSQSTAAAFGKGVSFRDLWECNEDKFAEAYPPDHQSPGAYDRSKVDSALASHLAFWTGKDCERIMRLMWQSALVRDKWSDREGYYLETTITRAVAVQTAVYSVSDEPTETTLADKHGGATLRGTPKQREYAESIREQKLAECADDPNMSHRLCRISAAKFWIDHKGETPAALDAMVAPVQELVESHDRGPVEVSGFQYLDRDRQKELFEGCVYIIGLNRIMTPRGTLLSRDQFNATYGGYQFQLNDDGQKDTKNAWDAFTASQILRWPKADQTIFKPQLEPGAMVHREGQVMVNSYVPIDTPRKAGDPTLFLDHLARLLPDEHDQAILLAYLAACVQHKGVKFSWCPLIQGTPGNGKTLITECLQSALGKKYTHLPKASSLDTDFNGWMANKLLIGVEDIYIEKSNKNMLQSLLPMVTGKSLEIQPKGVDQTTQDVCANFILNANKKEAVPKDEDDRRFAPLFCAQQHVADLARDGMTGEYFVNLYRWLESDGFAIVHDFLAEYAIPDALNPAGSCRRAPDTSSTAEAIRVSLGDVEQYVLEAVEEGRAGFAGGWVSSVALEDLLQTKRGAVKEWPISQRREKLNELGYDYHPALRDGRTNNRLDGVDQGKKPRLYIKKGHIHTNLTSAAEVARLYQEAQMSGPTSDQSAAAAFNR